MVRLETAGRKRMVRNRKLPLSLRRADLYCQQKHTPCVHRGLRRGARSRAGDWRRGLANRRTPLGAHARQGQRGDSLAWPSDRTGESGRPPAGGEPAAAAAERERPRGRGRRAGVRSVASESGVGPTHVRGAAAWCLHAPVPRGAAADGADGRRVEVGGQPRSHRSEQRATDHVAGAPLGGRGPAGDLHRWPAARRPSRDQSGSSNTSGLRRQPVCAKGWKRPSP